MRQLAGLFRKTLKQQHRWKGARIQNKNIFGTILGMLRKAKEEIWDTSFTFTCMCYKITASLLN